VIGNALRKAHWAEKLQKKYSIRSHKAHEDKKNSDHFNLSLCPVWFRDAFVFEDFLPKKQKIVT
jgi:hypothetical protein